MKKVNAIFGESSLDLESSFFLSEDRKLIEKLRLLQKMEETKENLRTVSGIQNDAVLQRLVELDIRPDLVLSLALVPVIEVAWADGEISEKERAAVIKAATDNGIAADEINCTIIEQWLTHKPDPKLLQAWSAYVSGLCELMTEAEQSQLKSEIIGKARAIAEASGGFLGIGRVSSEEEEVLAALAAAFAHS